MFACDPEFLSTSCWCLGQLRFLREWRLKRTWAPTKEPASFSQVTPAAAKLDGGHAVSIVGQLIMSMLWDFGSLYQEASWRPTRWLLRQRQTEL